MENKRPRPRVLGKKRYIRKVHEGEKVAKSKGRVRIWPDVVLYAAHKNPPTFTTADIQKELDMDPPGACQVLRRLQMWGQVRVVGFAAPVGGLGRRRKVYELTETGKKKADRLERNKK